MTTVAYRIPAFGDSQSPTDLEPPPPIPGDRPIRRRALYGWRFTYDKLFKAHEGPEEGDEDDALDIIFEVANSVDMLHLIDVYENFIWLSRNYLSRHHGTIHSRGLSLIPKKENMRVLTDALKLGEPEWHFLEETA
ncbi:unnamed protein product [Peniophora sp. CBMAI 1063]|nr:unnamed protein product [Peniophora sp. CBMAI 1063]